LRLFFPFPHSSWTLGFCTPKLFPRSAGLCREKEITFFFSGTPPEELHDSVSRLPSFSKMVFFFFSPPLSRMEGDQRRVSFFVSSAGEKPPLSFSPSPAISRGPVTRAITFFLSAREARPSYMSFFFLFLSLFSYSTKLRFPLHSLPLFFLLPCRQLFLAAKSQKEGNQGYKIAPSPGTITASNAALLLMLTLLSDGVEVSSSLPKSLGRTGLTPSFLFLQPLAVKVSPCIQRRLLPWEEATFMTKPPGLPFFFFLPSLWRHGEQLFAPAMAYAGSLFLIRRILKHATGPVFFFFFLSSPGFEDTVEYQYTSA